MKTSLKVIVLTAGVLVMANLLGGCAARRAEARAKLPEIDTVCVRLSGVPEPELGLLMRKSALLLKENGFRAATDKCDVTAQYTSLDNTQWEILHGSIFGASSKTSYSVEGILTVTRNEKIEAEDLPIKLRDYKSKLELLEALSEKVLDYVMDNYRPKISAAK